MTVARVVIAISLVAVVPLVGSALMVAFDPGPTPSLSFLPSVL